MALNFNALLEKYKQILSPPKMVSPLPQQKSSFNIGNAVRQAIPQVIKQTPIINLLSQIEPTQQVLQNIGQTRPQLTTNLLKLEKPTQKVSQFMQKPYNFTGLSQAASKIKAPIPRVVGQIGAGLTESFINMPAQIVGGATKTGLNIGRNYRGEKVGAKKWLAGAAPIGEALLTASTLNVPSNIVKNAAKETFKQAVVGGAKTGALYGGAYGALEGMKKEDLEGVEYYGNILKNAIISGGAGAILGGGIGGASHLFGIIKEAVIKNNPGIPNQEANKKTVRYLIDEVTGKFKGSRKKNEPVTYSEYRKSIGLSDNWEIPVGLSIKPKGGNKAVWEAEATKASQKSGEVSLRSPLSENLQQPQLSKKVVSSTIQEPSLVPTIDPVQKIINALKEAKPLEQKQAGIYAKIRSQQAGAVAGVGKNVPGEAGYFAQLGQLKGEMPKVSFESIRKQIGQPDIDSLFNKVEQSVLTPFEKVTAKSGLAKILGAEGGAVPVQSELKLLNEVFPPEFIQAVLDNRSNMQKLFSLGENALNLPRSIMATADLSAPLRQGAFLIGRPKQWIPAFKDMFKYAFSENAYKGLQNDIKARPTYPLMREGKLAITDMSPLLQGREEAFMSNLAEKIPIFGRLAKGSNRAYSGFLNKLRADVFDDLVKNAPSKDPQMIDSIANFVNTATGRGNLGAFQRAAPILNATLFSPRLIASRLNLLNPMYYVNLNPFVRKEAIKSLLTFAGTVGTVLTLAKLGGADVGIDPRSADFAKIKVGNTRFDIGAGFQQYFRAVAQLITGQYISTVTGKQVNLGEGYNTPTRKDILLRFFESKEAPVLSFATSLLEGKSALGDKLNVPVEIIDRFIPMVIQDMYNLYKERGIEGIGMAVPAMFGVGTQTYQNQIPMEGKTPMGKPNIQWRQPPGLGETILNKITGNEVSNIPEEQWQPLIDEKREKALWDIKYSGIKATVLETGETQIVENPTNGKTIQVSLENGIVKIKDITPKSEKTTTTKTKKATTKTSTKAKKAKVSTKKVSMKKVKTPKITKVSIPSPRFRKIKKYKISVQPLKKGTVTATKLTKWEPKVSTKYTKVKQSASLT